MRQLRTLAWVVMLGAAYIVGFYQYNAAAKQELEALLRSNQITVEVKNVTIPYTAPFESHFAGTFVARRGVSSRLVHFRVYGYIWADQYVEIDPSEAMKVRSL